MPKGDTESHKKTTINSKQRAKRDNIRRIHVVIALSLHNYTIIKSIICHVRGACDCHVRIAARTIPTFPFFIALNLRNYMHPNTPYYLCSREMSHTYGT